ncbi:MAG: MMPL family transporter [Byssovorax sp.]
MNNDPAEGGPAARFFSRLASFQIKRPAVVLLITALVTALALWRALSLQLLTGFEHLLPQNRPSVKELNRVAAKTAGVSTLFVVLHAGEGPAGPAPKEALRKAGDALVVELEKLGSPWIGSVEDGVQEAVRVMAPRAGLYANLADLKKLQEDLDARFEYEVNKQMGTALDPDEPPPAPIDAEDLKKRFGEGAKQAEEFPDGYYQSKDGKVVVVAARSKVLGSDLAKGEEALRRVREAIEKVNLASYHPSIHYGLAGDLYSGVAEVSAINRDLTEVGVTGILLIASVVFLYYLRFRTLVVMLITILIGVGWTFGVTEATIGHLNMATGFLVTIVAGNGINAGIIFMARYLEARRNHIPLAEAIEIAHQKTWLATLTACAAASASYATLGTTEFRGFRDFGLIGGAGMLLCWIATYFAMPSLLVMMERLSPLDSRATGRFARFRWGWGGAFGRPFAAIVPLAPRAITVVGLALSVAGTVALVRYIQQDPMEYDMKNLRNDLKARADESYNKKLADEITHYVGSDAMAILVDRPEQVGPLRDALYAKRDAAPEGKKPFKDLHALEDFVPTQQAEKIPVLLAIKDRVVRAHKRKLIPEDQWSTIERYLPPDDLKPLTMADLPTGLARPFTETDGTRGRIVYISPSEDTEDARYLLRWADAYRETHLPDQSVVLGSGRAVIYADMWAAILAAVPTAVSLSFLATLIVVVIAFRGARASLMVLGALLVGVAWLAGLLVLLKVRLNFLNFIALPITFGIGVDYAVNVVDRYRREGAGGALLAVRETGGAVILCSMTTTLGYLALVSSMNFAVRSLGVAAVLGEVACLAAAVLVLPAGLLWLDQRRAQRASAMSSEASG